MTARFEFLMGSPRLLERKRRLDDDANRARFEQRPHVLLNGFCDRTFLSDRSRAQRRSGEREAALKHWREADLRLRSALQANLHEPAIHCERVEIALDVFPAD